MIYKLFVGPLELLFELIFSLVYRHLDNAGPSIIILSLAVNFLVLPLYRRADTMQKEERDLEKKLDPWVSHIKATFTSDERYMMLQTFYRQNNYKPSYVLRSALPLLLQIPFFTAAYNFLSGLMLLQNTPFGPIRNLGAPDALLTVGGITLNVLPILMTIINFISSAVYMRGFPFKNKLLPYGMAVAFLILLYNAPAGLAFYWMLNNLFSLVKNIVYKIKISSRRLRISCIVASSAGLALLNAAMILRPADPVRIKLFITAGILILIALIHFIWEQKYKLPFFTDNHPNKWLFILGSILLTILTGILIPSEVLKSAAGDFININTYYSPLWYVLSSLLLAAGTFIVWGGIFYHLAVPFGKKVIGLGISCLAICSVVNYMFFGTERGVLSSFLEYETVPTDTVQQYLINIIVLIELILVVLFVWNKKNRLLNGAMLAFCLAAGIMSVINVAGIGKQLPYYFIQAKDTLENVPEINLSKNGKNVVILMMDRAIGYYVPFIMQEKPDVRAQFEGFTFYSNTLSYANKTNGGIPSIYGGYEYTPAMLNKRNTVLLADKHNEALLMMPQMFHEAGYDVTVIDPSYAGYRNISDLTIYDAYPYVHAYHLQGRFTTKEIYEAEIKTRERIFFCFSLYKTAPLFIQPMLYTGGLYNDPDAIAGKAGLASATQKLDGLYKASGIGGVYNERVASLIHISDFTIINDTDNNTYTTLDNMTTHSPQLLQMPDYTIEPKVDNTPFESNPITRQSLLGETIIMGTSNQVKHYHVNMSAFMQLGKWMDYLRDNDVYDNTRIIIVSDHGRDQGYDKFMFGTEFYEDALFFNPILLVKDFDSNQEFSIDSQFMTNADVPLLAMNGIIDNPVNPATGNPVTDEIKHEPVHEVERIKEFRVNVNNGTTYIPTQWYGLHGDNIFDIDQWEFLGIK